jgi:hypothetical protein
MPKRQRFYLNKERYVVDRLDWLNNGLTHMPEELPHSENDMRRDVFWKRLQQLIECLLLPHVRKKHGLYKPKRYEDAERAIVKVAMAICEARVDGFIDEPQVPAWPNEVTTPVERISDITSIGLFLRDLELLVCNIYGNGGREFVLGLRHAVVAILKLTMKEPVKHLWNEYDDACVTDGDLRIAGYYFKDDPINEAEAFDRIMIRAQKIRQDPTRFGKYTIEFVKRLDANLKQELQGKKPRTPKRDAGVSANQRYSASRLIV